MKRFDTLRRLRTLLADVIEDVEKLKHAQARLEIDWLDTKDRVTRSYQRLEKAGQRAAKREALPDPPVASSDALEGLSDPFSRKLRQVRDQTHAVHDGNNTRAG